MKGIGGHQRGFQGRTDEWLTPPEIFSRLGQFDLDPCSPINPPWMIAKTSYTIDDDGLSRKWFGKVWLNPPYGPETGKWLKKLADHGDGIALIFARTETEMFHQYGWDMATSMLFLKGRLHFCNLLGEKAKSNAGGPSVLIAYGDHSSGELSKCGIQGKFILLKR